MLTPPPLPKYNYPSGLVWFSDNVEKHNNKQTGMNAKLPNNFFVEVNWTEREENGF